MSINVTPHLNFRGEAREALEFYRSAFGGDLTVFSYSDMGRGADQGDPDQVAWGQVSSEAGFRLMAYDAYPELPWDRGQDPFFVSVRGDHQEELDQYWAKLSEGAEIIQPLGPAQWAPAYGMLKDRFGVTWVLDMTAGQ